MNWKYYAPDWYTSSICAKIDQAVAQSSVQHRWKSFQHHRTKIHQPLQRRPQIISPNRDRTHSKNWPNKRHPEIKIRNKAHFMKLFCWGRWKLNHDHRTNLRMELFQIIHWKFCSIGASRTKSQRELCSANLCQICVKWWSRNKRRTGTPVSVCVHVVKRKFKYIFAFGWDRAH